MPVTGIYGLLAEFESADELIAAAERVHAAGYTHAEAYSPYPLPEAAAALGRRRTGVAFPTFVGGLVGGAAAFVMMYWVAVVDYPINVGGRPLNSWPAWIPITFELTVLTAAFSAFFGLMLLCRLPRYHHPLFAAPAFARASTDRFYLCVGSSDPKYQPTETRTFLAALGSVAVEEVTA